MKRWPILVSFLLFVGLCASATFWAMQLFKPVARPVAMPRQSTKVEVDPEAALALFGGRTAAIVPASNFQLKGVVVAKNEKESVAILIADSKPALAVRVNAEVIPGVTVKEVHPQYVLLSDGGAIKRVDLPVATPSTRGDSPIGMIQQMPIAPPPTMAPNFTPPPPANPQNPVGQEGEAQVQPQNPPSPNQAGARIGRMGGRGANPNPNSN